MKTKIIMLALLGAIILSCGTKSTQNASNPDANVKDVAEALASAKTYYIEYVTKMEAEGTKSTTLMKQWVDVENGLIAMESETENEMMGQKTKMNSLMINNEKGGYVINLDEKTGFKMNNDLEDENPTDNIKPEDAETFRQMIESEGGKVLGNEDFLGKNCIVTELTEDGNTVKMWYYKGIPLKMESKSYTMEATKFEESVSIPASRFEIPAGIKITEIPGF
jgi:outer membrane lipoprotein-sorting protein